jgi:hypothetical protein
MLTRERELDARLDEVIAHGNFSAERVASASNAKLIEMIGICLDENRDVQSGESECIEDTFFVAEIGQDNEDAVDFIAVSFEKLGALARVGMRFDPTELRLLRPDHNRADVAFPKELDDILARFGDELVRKEFAIANDDTEGGGACWLGRPVSTVRRGVLPNVVSDVLYS